MAFSFADNISSEENMTTNLSAEAINLFSHEVWYFPLVDFDIEAGDFLGEDTTPGYAKGFVIRAWSTYADAEDEIFDLMGLHLEPSIVMYVAVKTFNDIIKAELEDTFGVSVSQPKEGDIIRAPGYEQSSWQVSHVQPQPWLTGQDTVYVLTLTPWFQAHESLNIDTGATSATQSLTAGLTMIEDVTSAVQSAISEYSIEEEESTVLDGFWNLDI